MARRFIVRPLAEADLENGTRGRSRSTEHARVLGEAVLASARARLQEARERESAAAGRVAHLDADLGRLRIELVEAESVPDEPPCGVHLADERHAVAAQQRGNDGIEPVLTKLVLQILRALEAATLDREVAEARAFGEVARDVLVGGDTARRRRAPTSTATCTARTRRPRSA